ncbi:MAG: hypothetical protein NTX53_19140, partial [candidate division WOR-3 bacterium]|nr:hypothetical protein [candidate division WOR-3 bacterium]
MPDMLKSLPESVEADIAAVKSWAKVISRNEKVESQQLMSEALAVRDQAMRVYSAVVPRDERTGKPIDPMMAAVEDLVAANQSELADRIQKAVYAGKVEYTDILDIVRDAAKDKSTSLYQNLSAVRDVSVRSGAEATSCGACAACLVLHFINTVTYHIDSWRVLAYHSFVLEREEICQDTAHMQLHCPKQK